MGAYVTGDQLRTAAEANESSTTDIFTALALAVSRLFDREAEVPDSFFDVAPGSAAARIFRGNNTGYINLGPYIPGSITAITDTNGAPVALATGSTSDLYREQDCYLIFNSIIPTGFAITVTAKYGFASIPEEIAQACLEQGLFMWRRKDLAFTDLAGISSSAVAAEFSPTFSAVTKRYCGIYGRSSYFA